MARRTGVQPVLALCQSRCRGVVVLVCFRKGLPAQPSLASFLLTGLSFQILHRYRADKSRQATQSHAAWTDLLTSFAPCRSCRPSGGLSLSSEPSARAILIEMTRPTSEAEYGGAEQACAGGS